MTMLAALAASLVAAALPLQDKPQDERLKRILERVEKEIRESHDRLREEIRQIVRAELAPGGAKAPARKKVLLGITADDLTDAERASLGIGGGIKVAAVRGPAEQAGIKPGDILLELGGTPVTEETIARTLEKYQPGDAAEAVVLRDKRRVTLKITLAERKE